MAAPIVRTTADPDGELPTVTRRLGLTPEDVRCLRAVPLFSGLRAQQIDAVLSDAHVRNYPRNTVLFVQGDAADRLFVVLQGWVRVLRTTRDGGEITIRIFGRGESLAEAAVLQMGRFPVTGETAEASRLLIIPASTFRTRLREDSALCFNILASMARRLHDFVQQLEQLSACSSAERLALFLLRLCHREEGPCTLHLPLDKTLIAARLGMQPETLSRCLARLRKLGVETRGHEVHVADVGRLRRFAHPEGSEEP